MIRCKIYRRVRWLDDTETSKVKDWKIKLIQMEEPKDMDYIVVRKLPCPLG
jgi:hypothetical protein